jgi:cellulose synthase/poly-beta-1,6-N-acetylglucosamine synthase-like glycosyltransferase
MPKGAGEGSDWPMLHGNKRLGRTLEAQSRNWPLEHPFSRARWGAGVTSSRNSKLRPISKEGGERADAGDEKLEKQAQQAIEEARMVLPGIQALFGFQLIAVFNNSFGKLTADEQVLHFVAVLLVAVSIALIMTPAAYHRQTEPAAASYFFVWLASLLVAAAMIPLMAALCIEVYLLGLLIIGSSIVSAFLATALFALFTGLWFVFPQLMKRR